MKVPFSEIHIYIYPVVLTHVGMSKMKYVVKIVLTLFYLVTSVQFLVNLSVVDDHLELLNKQL